MNGNAEANKNQAEKLYRVLSQQLRKNKKGKELITAFEDDPDQGSEALADYLREQLPKDDALAGQIAEALGTEGDTQFNTIVTGGQVDQIINIARLGVLNLTLKKYFYFFRDVKQLLTFLLIVIAVSAGIGYVVWAVAQPDRMVGDFNIAVAEYAEIPESPNPIIAPIASQILFNYIDNEYQDDDLDIKVKVQHDKIPVIGEVAEAEKLAEKINADIIFYGDVALLGNSATIFPKFFVAETFRSDVGEVTGYHQLSYPLDFNPQEAIQFDSETNTAIRDRSIVLVEFTKALSFLVSDDLNNARIAIQNTLELANNLEAFDGKEVFYLFASTIARLNGNYESANKYADQALEINDQYGRGYIAKANVYYDLQDFESAKTYYQKALDLEDQPYGAHIPEKANYGLGSIYNYQFQISEQPDRAPLAQSALEHYQKVIEEYENTQDRRIKDLGAWSYYGSGIIYQLDGDFEKAIEAYKRTLELTDDPDLISRTQGRLDESKRER